ncbi:MAG TPA: MFS transporter [Thermomicrobiales bacterium]|nr:MFS transporter [Thermomicrobiales bacterium]
MRVAAKDSIWRSADFRRLWMAQTVSEIGSQVSFLALPLVATMVLQASALEMGLLTAAGALPSLLLGLHAGAMIDRRRKRPLMVMSDVGRAALLAVIPLAWLCGVLDFELLILVALLGGVFTLVFQVASQSFLPLVLVRGKLVDGNSKLELSRSVAEVVGPGLGGWLISLLTAPLSLLVDASSYLCSALFLSGIQVPESNPAVGEGRVPWRREIGDGMRAVLAEPRLRVAAGAGSLLEFFNAMLEAVFVLFLVRELGLKPGLIGLVFMIGSVGFVVGAMAPDYLTRRFGLGRMTTLSVLLIGVSDMIVPFAYGAVWMVLSLMVVAQLTFGIGLTIFRVNRSSLLQALIPASMRARATATMRTLTMSLVPVGALAGGLLGTWAGIRETLVIAATGEIVAALWIWHSPLREMRAIPTADGIPEISA